MRTVCWSMTDAATNGFKIDADTLVVANLDSELLMGNAETVAAWAKDNGRLTPFANNCTNAGDANCRRTFIQNLGLKAFREDLSEAQVAPYDALFQEFSGGDFLAGAEMVATAMLQSVNMLYWVEIEGLPANGDNPRTRLTNLERWLATQFVAAADKLKSLPAPDGNGTLFDQALMVWARDMGDAVEHRGDDMRFVFAGGAGGYLRTSPRRPLHRRWRGRPPACPLSMAEAMGSRASRALARPAGPRRRARHSTACAPKGSAEHGMRHSGFARARTGWRS